MPPKVREVKADLRKRGWNFRPGKGGHTVWEHPLLPSVTVTISGNDGDDAQPYQEAQVGDALAKLREVQRSRP